MKIKPCTVLTLALALCLLCACTGRGEQGRAGLVDLADPIGGSSIVTAEDLLTFFARGEGDVAVLAADISLENAMLCVTQARNNITIEGNGFTLSGAGDCVLRLEDGCSVTLNNLTLHGGADAIGFLGDAKLGGRGATILGGGNGIRGTKEIVILTGSDIAVTANKGIGVQAGSITLQSGAALSAQGPLGGISAEEDDISLEAGSRLSAYTDMNYNALRCAGTLIMKEGSACTVENKGEYHGAELGALSVEGTVTIQAKGGAKGAGLFLFEQLEDITVLGACTPKPRFESGKGSIAFAGSKGAQSAQGIAAGQ
ncbi:MAG: hypothetical protein LBN26_02365 [Christensenellaceae bacterium]|jgi:hypothetical protein|nr:hypothetical protein [Christensenellaceae bacterium]